MRSPAAHILETALALQRAPGERFRLRERPLPPGVIHLIEIASGSPQAVQSAAAELGEPEPVLLEAARFYLEQVLFADPDADAYRVLGLAPDAPHDTIRTHHRWLQRWLHPDRAQAGDASIFATRVNQAFAQLRTPELRHTHDVRLAEARMAGASAPLPAATLRRWELGDDGDGAGRVGRRSRWLLAAAALSCVVLAVLIVRNPQNAATWQDDAHSEATQAAEPVDAPAIEDRDLGILSDALTLTPAEPAPAPAPAADGPSPSAVDDLPSLDLPAVAPAAGAPALAAPAVAAPTLVAAAITRRASPPAAAGAPRPARRPQAAAGLAPAPMSAAASARAPTPTPSIEAAAPVPLASRETAEPAAVSAVQPAVPPPQPDPAVQRRAAEQRADEVVRYLGGAPGIVPLWNDPDVEAQAARLRGALNARSGSLKLTQTAWAVGADSASLAASYRCRSASKGECEGRLTVDLMRRGGFWFVRRVALAPPA